jgi:hypothetical protein
VANRRTGHADALAPVHPAPAVGVEGDVVRAVLGKVRNGDYVDHAEVKSIEFVEYAPGRRRGDRAVLDAVRM